jgi:hypothetical protein
MPELDEPMSPRDEALAQALRALPLAAPEASAWPMLQAQLRRRARAPRPRHRFAFAAAAALAMLALLPWLRRTPAPPVHDSAPAVVARSDDADAARWIAQSQAFEAALRGSPVGYEPLDAGAAMASAEIEDLIGMIDLQLSQADDPRVSSRLWQQRVALMQELADVRGEGAWRLAATDQGGTVMPAAYRID